MFFLFLFLTDNFVYIAEAYKYKAAVPVVRNFDKRILKMMNFTVIQYAVAAGKFIGRTQLFFHIIQ